ncbi:MAG: hypothetical protein WC910_07295 [Bacteroidales bacterium]|jgi:hypothetical protein
MVYDNQKRILKKDLKRDLATFNRQPKGGSDEVKMSKQEAIEFCKLLEGAKRIIQGKIAKA